MRVNRVIPGQFVAPLVSVRILMSRIGYKSPLQFAQGEYMNLSGNKAKQKNLFESMVRRTRANVRQMRGSLVDMKA